MIRVYAIYCLMQNECLICAEPSSDRYSVSLGNSRTVEKKIFCDGCVSDLRNEGWIDVRGEPVLASDGGSSEGNKAQ